MAVPTNFRLEAVAPTVVKLRWTDADANDVVIHRSSNGTDFALLDTITTGLEIYTDETVSPETRYWFKISQDAGANFTTALAVWTHSCLIPRQTRIDLSLQRAHGDEVEADEFNRLAEQVEEKLQPLDNDTIYQNCFACPSEGRIILDCSLGCRRWTVVATEDINSISLIGCGDCPPISFIIPPGETRKICGWPSSCGFEGDECFHSPIDGGDGLLCTEDGTCIEAPPRIPRILPCPCPITGILMQIICCDDPCDLNCETPTRVLRGCGGFPESDGYKWSVEGPGTLQVDKGMFNRITCNASITDEGDDVIVTLIDRLGQQAILNMGDGCLACCHVKETREPNPNCANETIEDCYMTGSYEEA